MSDDYFSKKNVSDDYFKGYFAFALWGYIPPDGGKQYKTSFIETVVKKDMTIKSEGEMKNEVEERSYMKELDERGVKKDTVELRKLTDLMVKWRVEMRKQRLFQCRKDKIEFEMRYHTTRIKEISDELKDLREDELNGDDNTKEQANLKIEMKNVRQAKKNAFINWRVVTEAEEGRRAFLEMEDEESEKSHADNSTSDTLSTKSKTVSLSIPESVGVTKQDDRTIDI